MGKLVSGDIQYATVNINNITGNEPEVQPFTLVNKEYTQGVDVIEGVDDTASYTPMHIDLIPRMTSNTAPSGVAACSSYLSNNNNYNAYQAFARNPIGGANSMTFSWVPETDDETPWLSYTWDEKHILSKIQIETANEAQRTQFTATRTVVIEGYDEDNDIWENCLASGNNISLTFYPGKMTLYEFDLNNKEYSAIRIVGNEIWTYPIIAGVIYGPICAISEMQVLYIGN